MGKIFGRSAKNFGRLGQFLKVWKKIRNVRGKNFGKNVWKRIQGVKNFGNEGEGRFREILSCPPPKMRVAPQMPPLPQIPRPGASTDFYYILKFSTWLISFTVQRLVIELFYCQLLNYIKCQINHVTGISLTSIEKSILLSHLSLVYGSNHQVQSI